MKEKYFEIPLTNVKCKIYYKNLDSIKNVVISCHGYGGNKENSATKKLADKLGYRYDDIAVVIFDWPCHGKDIKQKLDLESCNLYLESVINYIKQTINPDKLFLNATSFGGYLNLKYVYEHENPYDKIILRCPAVNMNYVLTNKILTSQDNDNLARGRKIISGFERKMVITNDFVNSLIKNDITKYDYSPLADKIFIMHGTKDETVPFSAVEEFSQKNGIDFLPIDGADHMFKDPSKISIAIDWIVETIDEEIQKNRSMIDSN